MVQSTVKITVQKNTVHGAGNITLQSKARSTVKMIVERMVQRTLNITVQSRVQSTVQITVHQSMVQNRVKITVKSMAQSSVIMIVKRMLPTCWSTYCLHITVQYVPDECSTVL